MNTGFIPRPSQRPVVAYDGGMLGVSAVPGSGKTHTLSALAARLIRSQSLKVHQEILVVTLVNSAVENFSSRIAKFTASAGLLPHLGYRVRTLHGLAHDIVREDPPLAGLDKAFTIVDDVSSVAMIRDAARSWVIAHPDVRDAYVNAALGEKSRQQVKRDYWPHLVEELAANFIKAAKDRRLSPQALLRCLDQYVMPLPLARMGAEIYAHYEAGLAYRGAVDFDDLIRHAAQMLDASPELLDRLCDRWPFVLEDEAQDSSRLQERILSRLVGEHGNWVRVGDPNQAIYETFTTADPQLLKDFIQQHSGIPMPESGRCQPSIMALANHLVDWTMNEHPNPECRNALSPPLIRPSPPDDPQPNPPDDPSGITFIPTSFSPDQEVAAVVKSLQHWLPGHADCSVAVLSSTNDHAARVVKALQEHRIKYRELLRSTSPTRAVAGALSHVLSFLCDPGSSPRLAQAYRVWRRHLRADVDRGGLIMRTAQVLRKLKRVEDYVDAAASADGGPSLAALAALPLEEQAAVRLECDAFRPVLVRWLEATTLPVDQLMLTLAQDIFFEMTDLALAHKLAIVMGQLSEQNASWRLPDLTPHLNEIARNERKFIGFSSDDAGFDPDQHRGEVVVATLHKAKGLEWDRVYLLSVNNYDFPAAVPGDHFIAEKWFIRDQLNVEAEAIAQLEVASQGGKRVAYEEGPASLRARVDYARERLRLLYVGITRARRELVLTWNTGRRGDASPAVAFEALQHWWLSIHPWASS